MKMQLKTITPETAARFLTKNSKNRPMQPRTWAKYSEDMKRGEFIQTGDTIKFSKKGALLDGQHRLKAIVESGMTQAMFVATGLDDESFAYMDVGKKRSISDTLSIEGCKNSAAVGAALRTLHQLRAAERISVTAIVSRGGMRSYVLLELFKKEPTLEDFVTDITRFSFFRKFFGSGVLGMFYDKYQENPALVLSFIEQIDRGANLSEKSPILYLRNYMMKEELSSYKMAMGMRYYLIAKIWEDYRTGKAKRIQMTLPAYTLDTLLPLIK